MESVSMDFGVFSEWRMVEVDRRPTEDSAFKNLEMLYRYMRPMTQLDREVLELEHKCLRLKPHFSKSQSARATWVAQEYNRKYGYGLGAKQVNSILFKCTKVMERDAIIHDN